MNNNIGAHIISEQNKQESIAMLAAQRHLYSKAKTWFYFQIILVTILPVLLAFYSLVFKKSAEANVWIFSGYTVIAAILELIIGDVIDKLKKLAAAIQEFFDTNVLQIDWNYAEISAKPQQGVIYRYFQQEQKKKDISNLKDWYSPVISTVETNIATVICQRTNCTYDFTLRERFSFWLKAASFILMAILLLFWLGSDRTLVQLVIQVIAPTIPLTILVANQYKKNKESVSTLSDLRTLIEGELANATKQTQVKPETIRAIQNKLYCNRILSPLLPDWIFNRWRGQLEEEMHYEVDILVNQLNP